MDTRELLSSIFSTIIKIVIIIVAGMLIYKYVFVAYDFGYRVFGEKPMTEGEGRTVTIAIGSEMSSMDIGKALENKGLIRDAKLFFVQEKLSEHAGEIKPGMYELNTSMTVEEMIAIMADQPMEAEEEFVPPTTSEDNDDEILEQSVDSEEGEEEGAQ